MMGRVVADGRHLRLNGNRFVVKGTAYGRFAPRTDGARYPEPARLQADLESIASTGLNTIRTFDVPPVDFLDAAAEVGLRVLVGLDYPDWRFEPFPDRASVKRVRSAGMAAIERLFDRLDDSRVVFAVSVGQPLPLDLIRVHQPAVIADTLSSLVRRIEAVDSSVPVTYTARADHLELLTLDGSDLSSIVFDGSDSSAFAAHLARLQQLNPARPLVVTDLDTGSADIRPRIQAEHLTEVLRGVDLSGCAGATVATWSPDPLLDDPPDTRTTIFMATPDGALSPIGRAVESWARSNISDLRPTWPRVSVVVDGPRAGRAVAQTVESLEQSHYPDLEVTAGEPAGPSANPADTATGEIVISLDAGTRCEPTWPWLVALALDDARIDGVVGRYELVVDGDQPAVAAAAAALSDVAPRSYRDPGALVGAGAGALALRRSQRSAGVTTSAVFRSGPAGQLRRPAPNDFRAVWRRAVALGRADRRVRGSTGAFAPMVTSMIAGERPPRPTVIRALLDGVMPLTVGAIAQGCALIAVGATMPGVVLAGAAAAIAVMLVAVLAGDVISARREPAWAGPSTAMATAVSIVTVAAIAAFEPLGRVWGYTWSAIRPTRPDEWPDDDDAGGDLNHLRRRLASNQLSVVTPPDGSGWNIEVGCGLFLRRLIVTAVAWQCTPHVRTALRPRRLLAVPVLCAAAAFSWSPMLAALIASATVGELAFELVTLRRVDGVISRWVATSLPPLDEVTTAEPAVELEARSTLEL